MGSGLHVIRREPSLVMEVSFAPFIVDDGWQEIESKERRLQSL